MLAALQAAAPVLATALAWLLPTLRAAFWGVFWALRLGVYAVLVWTAWENIIEEQGAPQPSKVQGTGRLCWLARQQAVVPCYHRSMQQCAPAHEASLLLALLPSA